MTTKPITASDMGKRSSTAQKKKHGKGYSSYMREKANIRWGKLDKKAEK